MTTIPKLQIQTTETIDPRLARLCLDYAAVEGTLRALAERVREVLKDAPEGWQRRCAAIAQAAAEYMQPAVIIASSQAEAQRMQERTRPPSDPLALAAAGFDLAAEAWREAEPTTDCDLLASDVETAGEAFIAELTGQAERLLAIVELHRGRCVDLIERGYGGVPAGTRKVEALASLLARWREETRRLDAQGATALLPFEPGPLQELIDKTTRERDEARAEVERLQQEAHTNACNTCRRERDEAVEARDAARQQLEQERRKFSEAVAEYAERVEQTAPIEAYPDAVQRARLKLLAALGVDDTNDGVVDDLDELADRVVSALRSARSTLDGATNGIEVVVRSFAKAAGIAVDPSLQGSRLANAVADAYKHLRAQIDALTSQLKAACDKAGAKPEHLTTRIEALVAVVATLHGVAAENLSPTQAAGVPVGPGAVSYAAEAREAWEQTSIAEAIAEQTLSTLSAIATALGESQAAEALRPGVDPSALQQPLTTVVDRIRDIMATVIDT